MYAVRTDLSSTKTMVAFDTFGAIVTGVLVLQQFGVRRGARKIGGAAR